MKTSQDVLDAIKACIKHQLQTHRHAKTITVAGFGDELAELLDNIARNAATAIGYELESDFLDEAPTAPIPHETLAQVDAAWRAERGAA